MGHVHPAIMYNHGYTPSDYQTGNVCADAPVALHACCHHPSCQDLTRRTISTKLNPSKTPSPIKQLDIWKRQGNNPQKSSCRRVKTWQERLRQRSKKRKSKTCQRKPHKSSIGKDFPFNTRLSQDWDAGFLCNYIQC